MSERILVFGAGAVGCYFSAVLKRSGASVSLFARGEALDAIVKDGIIVEGASGDFSIMPDLVTNDIGAVGAPQFVILATKAWQVRDAVRLIAPVLHADAKILTLQNGVDAPEEVASEVGAARTLIGVCRIACSSVTPGQVRHDGVTPAVGIGELGGAPISRGAMTLAAALVKAGVKASLEADPTRDLWQKLIFIATLAGMGSVCRSAIGAVRTEPESRAMMMEILEEAGTIAQSSGMGLVKTVVEEIAANLDQLPPETKASMQRDIETGRPSELDAIIGSLIRKADLIGANASALRHIYASLLPQEKRARSAL